MTAAVHATPKPWIDEADLHLDDFRAQVLRSTDPADYPLATDVRINVLVYSAATVAGADRRALQSEVIRALADGPGVVAFEGAFDVDVVDRASEAFFAIIDAQRAAGAAAGDHFGKPGANDRIWNAAQKLALHDPHVFVRADVVVEREADALGVEGLRRIDVADGDGNDFEPQIHGCHLRWI